MRRLQNQPLFRLACVLMMLLFFYLAGLSACGIVHTRIFLFSGSWEYQYFTRNLMLDRAEDAAMLDSLKLEQQNLQEMESAGEDVTYRLTRLKQQISDLESSLSRENTIFRCTITDAAGQVLFSSLQPGNEVRDETVYPNYGVYDAGDTEIKTGSDDYMRWTEWSSTSASASPGADSGTEEAPETSLPPRLIEYGISTAAIQEMPNVHDEFTSLHDDCVQANAMAPSAAAKTAVFALAGLVCMLLFLWSCGHTDGTAGIRTTWQERIYIEVYAAADLSALLLLVCGGLLILSSYSSASWTHYSSQAASSFPFLLTEHILALLLALSAGCLTLLLRTAVLRVKAGTLSQTSLLFRFWNWFKGTAASFLRNSPLWWKTALYFVSWPVLLFLLLAFGLYRNIIALTAAAVLTGIWILIPCWRFLSIFWNWFRGTASLFLRNIPLWWKTALYFVSWPVLLFLLLAFGLYRNIIALTAAAVLTGIWILIPCWWVLSIARIRKGARTMASGHLDCKLDTGRMPRELKELADDLNNISAGLNRALEEQIKSERFKAELITNVSHDLKTPLTSLISYVDLLRNTEQTDPRALEYIEVLDRKSQRLKKLTADLVEASKASTGAIRVEKEKIGLLQLVDQAMAEWSDRLEASHLTPVVTRPREEIWITADGRHLWRVLDNLLSNCTKYSLEGTRVYLDIVREESQASVSIKNVSRDALNIPPEQLMERFVRGDESRSTEGSGLGLSIARSLTELQGGTFQLSVDGDLFKAVITLPLAP